MLTHYAIPEVQRQNALSEYVYMQYGTLPHVGSPVKSLLSQHFVTEFSRHFRGHQNLLISDQRISGCGDM